MHGFGAFVLFWLAVGCVGGFPSITAAVEYAKPISLRLNTTGRAIDMEVPLKDGTREIGDIPVRINPDDTVLVARGPLAEMLGGIVGASTRQQLLDIPGDSYVSLLALRAAGFDVRFDPGLQELTLETNADQRAPADISLRGGRRQLSSSLAPPAFVSGYVNLYASLDHQWESESSTFSSPASTSGRLEIESAVRISNVVIENSGVVAGAVDVAVCPTAAVCDYVHTPGFKRQTSRLIYDMPEQRVRVEVGDVEPLGTSFQRMPDLLGFSVEKSARKLSPGDTFAPTGGGSFRIERPSDVEIRVNGTMQQHLQLRPGIYNIRDLPLAAGANNVDVVITDDAGNQRTFSFTSFFDASLLAEGKSEWGVTAGAPSYFRDEAREYIPDLVMGSAFWRYGITDAVTGEADAQADSRVAVAGAGVVTDTPWGLFGLRAAASAGDPGAGGAVSIDWSAVNFEGLTGRRGESARISAEYRSPGFHLPGDINTADTGILYPEWNYWLNVNASYSAPIGYDTTLSLSGRYQFVNDAQIGDTFYDWHGDRYGADVTLSRPLTPTVSANLTLGYSNETYLSALAPQESNEPEFRVAARIFVRPDEHTNVTAGFDTLNQQSDLSAYRSEGSGVGRWDTSVSVQQNEFDERASVAASASYYGNRGQIRVIHNSGFSGVSFADFKAQPGAQRTSLEVGTAIAFADGKFAVGAPVTGDAFAIVYPHESIADKLITVGANDNVRAIADGWGPALVTSVPAYSPSTIAVDADDLPIGYSLGSAAFDTFAPYKGGYALEVGSDYSVSAYGTLLLADGAPVSLLTGVARSLSHPEKTVTIFTNASGRFGAEGLAPGRWIIEVETEGAPATYALDIPPGANGLFKAGTLYPGRAR